MTVSKSSKKSANKVVPDIPVNAECLSELTFVFTGDMEHFSKESAKDFVTERGGMFRTSVSKKTTHLVTGSNVGEKKLEDAKEKGVEVISEEDFISMVKEKSSMGDDGEIQEEDEEGTAGEEEGLDEIVDEQDDDDEDFEVDEKEQENLEEPIHDLKKRKQENLDSSRKKRKNVEMEVNDAAVNVGEE
eukprot:NODE_30_length_37342_cov_0.449507.p21 type:complete len:188 gc:universal NODE_30_length_37342_cov_0.449507:4982-5545(+)